MCDSDRDGEWHAGQARGALLPLACERWLPPGKAPGLAGQHPAQALGGRRLRQRVVGSQLTCARSRIQWACKVLTCAELKGALPPHLDSVPWWHRVGGVLCLVRLLTAWFDGGVHMQPAGYGCPPGGRLLCCWPVLVGWRFSCVCASGGFLLYFLIADACVATTCHCSKKANRSNSI